MFSPKQFYSCVAISGLALASYMSIARGSEIPFIIFSIGMAFMCILSLSLMRAFPA